MTIQNLARIVSVILIFQRTSFALLTKFFIICLFLAVLGLRCCMWASSSCGKWELLSSCGVQASHYRAFSFVTECGLQDTWASAVVHVGSAVAPGLSRTGSVVVAHGLSCPIGIWDLPQAGIEPVSPALPRGFFRVFYI